MNHYEKIIKNTLISIKCKNCGKELNMKDVYYLSPNSIINILCEHCYNILAKDNNIV